jgi:hypothetical protein
MAIKTMVPASTVGGSPPRYAKIVPLRGERTMLRVIGGTIVGIVVWLFLVTVIDRGLRFEWHDYMAVYKAMAFTLPMMAARLSESAVSSLVSGYVAASIGRGRWAPILSGVILLLPFIYIHSQLWHRFPIWYHLTFLTSLLVLSVVGGMFARNSTGAA